MSSFPSQAPGPQWYRYVNYVANRVLLASELVSAQQMARNVDANGNLLAFEQNAVYRDGATLNCSISVAGTTVTISQVDTSRPMLIFCRGQWEYIWPQSINLVASTAIYLNYVVTTIAQSSGDAEMAQLTITLSNADGSGTPNSAQGQLELNPAPIVVFNFANTNGTATYQPNDNVYAVARAGQFQAGPVLLTTPSSSGRALSSDDAAVTNERVPLPNSVNSSTVQAVVTNGTNTDGSAKVDPTQTTGIQAAQVIYAAGTQTVEAALTSAASSVAAVNSSLNNHIGRPLGNGVHPMPSYADVGAAPISHVGAAFDGQHQPTLTNDTTGFIVTRNPANAPANGTFAYLLRASTGAPIAGILQSGDILSTNSSYPYLSSALNEVVALNGQVTTLNGEVTTLNTEVATLNAEVATLNTQVATQGQEITALTSTVTTQGAEITAIEAKQVRATLTNPAAARQTGETYTNSNALPLFVSGALHTTGSSVGSLTCTVAGTPVYEHEATATVDNATVGFVFLVPAGATYSVSCNGAVGGIAVWTETTLQWS